MEPLLLPIRFVVALMVLGFVDHTVVPSSQPDRSIALHMAQRSHPDADVQVLCCEEPCEPERPVHYPDQERITRVLDYRRACLTSRAKRPEPAKRYGIYARRLDFTQVADLPTPYTTWHTKPVNWDSLEMAMRAERLCELAHILDSLIGAMRKDSTVIMP